jgi:hypothetical protein
MRSRSKRGYKWFFQRGKIEIDWDTGCWIWLGAQYPDGYGKINTWTINGWQPRRSQQYFWELYRGSARGMDVGHNCHRRLCVKLRHLFPKTHTDNMREMHAYELGEAERSEVCRMMLEGLDYTLIAEKLLAPRPVIIKALKGMNWRQNELFG